MEIELTQVYTCPRCGLDTPHFVLARRGDRVGVECSQCHTSSLVMRDDLSQHQFLWEEELRQILNSLEDSNPDDER